MAMEIFREIPSIHEENVVCIAFDRARKAVYTVGDGDTGIKAKKASVVLCAVACSRRCVAALCFTDDAPDHNTNHKTGVGPEDRRAAAHAVGAHGGGHGVRLSAVAAAARVRVDRRRARRVERQGHAAAGLAFDA
jgi:hypothetical protein